MDSNSFVFIFLTHSDVSVLSAASEDPLSPPSQRSRSHDTSTELQPMPTSPTMDILGPAANDVSLFSSPVAPRSGTPLSFQQQCTFSFKRSFQFNSFGCVSVMQSEMDASSPLMYGTPSSRIEGTPRSGIRGTPARQRADLGSVRKGKQVDIHSEPVRVERNTLHLWCKWIFDVLLGPSLYSQPSGDAGAAGDQGQRLVIWGTDVNVGTCKEKFQVGILHGALKHLIRFMCLLYGKWLMRFFLLQRFLQRFTDPNSREDENAGLDLNEPLYMQKLDEVRFTNLKDLQVCIARTH